MAEVRTTSSTGGQKGVKLARFDLIPAGPLRELAEHYGRGARKYANHQWRNGYEWSKSIGALGRHFNDFMAGLDYDVCSNDPDGCSMVDAEGQPYEPVGPDTCFNHTGSHHMAAVAWHSFLLLEFKDTHIGHDDRYREPVCGVTVGPIPKLDNSILTCTLAPHGDDVAHTDEDAVWANPPTEDEQEVITGIRDTDLEADELAQRSLGCWYKGKRAEVLVDAEEPISEIVPSVADLMDMVNIGVFNRHVALAKEALPKPNLDVALNVFYDSPEPLAPTLIQAHLETLRKRAPHRY